MDMIETIRRWRYRRRERARWARRAEQGRIRREAWEAKRAAWQRRGRPIALDNALWAWRVAPNEAARNEVMALYGELLREYWRARDAALQQARARVASRRR